MKVTLLMAQSVDGKVARSANEFINWTSSEDKKMFVAETKRARAVVMGRKTFDTIGKPLPGRHIIVMTRQTTPSNSPSPFLGKNGEGEKTSAFFSPFSEGGDQEGVDRGTVQYTNDPPRTILKKLGEQGFTEVIIAGGPTINTLFLKDSLINEIKLTIEPKLFGRGLSLFEGIEADVNLELIECKKLTNTVLWVHYRVGN